MLDDDTDGTYITLPLRLSTVIATTRTGDAVVLDEARREMRQLALAAARKAGKAMCEVYACERHGGHVVDVVEVPSARA